MFFICLKINGQYHLMRDRYKKFQFFLLKINNIHSFELKKSTSIQCKFAKNKKDEHANKLTTSMLTA